MTQQAGKPIEPTDDDILAMLAEHPGLLRLRQDEADVQVKRAIELPQSPRAYIFWQLDRLTAERTREVNFLAARGRPTEPYLFRHFDRASRFFADLVKRWTETRTITALRDLSRELDREMEQEAIRALSASHRLASCPVFDARAFVERLAGRGVVLRAAHGGKLEAIPSAKLDDADRTMIKSNLPALKQAVASMTETF